MTYMQFFIEIMTNPDSPFSEMRHYGVLDIGTLAGNILSNVMMWIGKGLAALVDACEEFANAAYNFLSFSGNDTFVSLYNTINKYLFIPLLIVFAIIAIKLTVGANRKGESKEVLKNLGIMFFVVAILPSIFSYINQNVFGKDFLFNMQGERNQIRTEYVNNENGSGTYRRTGTLHYQTANNILRSNTYDFYYLYNHSDLKNIFNGHTPDDAEGTTNKDVNTVIENLKELQEKYPDSFESERVTFSDSVFDPNIGLDSDHGYDDLSQFFQYKVTEDHEETVDDRNAASTSTQLYKVSQNWGGIPIVNWGHECYIRYNVDYLNLFIQLLAVAIMYFCIGYSVIKLIIELMVHQLFGGIIAATDLTGGQRIKKFLGSILGIYFALLLSALTVLLFMAARNFAVNLIGSRGLGDSLITIALAITMLDIPNIVARYFNINTGIRGGMGMAGFGLLAAGRAVARNAGRVARAPFRAMNSTMESAQATRAEKTREARREAENEQQRMERADREAERNAERSRNNIDEGFNRSTDEQGRRMADFDNRQDEFRNQHGTDGDYEKFEQPIEYNKENEGSQENIDAIHQRAGAVAAYNDSMGEQKGFEDNIRSGSVAAGATEDETQKALKANPATVNDAKQGLYSGIAKEAQNNGGKPADYTAAAQKASANLNVGDGKEGYVSYLSDAAYNSAHSSQIRHEAINIQSMNRGMSDQDAYIRAMDKVSGTYSFATENKAKIAAAELRDTGSLRQGNIYDKRPKEYKVSSKTALN